MSGFPFYFRCGGKDSESHQQDLDLLLHCKCIIITVSYYKFLLYSHLKKWCLYKNDYNITHGYVVILERVTKALMLNEKGSQAVTVWDSLGENIVSYLSGWLVGCGVAQRWCTVCGHCWSTVGIATCSRSLCRRAWKEKQSWLRE